MKSKKVYEVIFGAFVKDEEYLNFNSCIVLAVNAEDAINEAKKKRNISEMNYFIESVKLLIGKIEN